MVKKRKSTSCSNILFALVITPTEDVSPCVRLCTFLLSLATFLYVTFVGVIFTGDFNEYCSFADLPLYLSVLGSINIALLFLSQVYILCKVLIQPLFNLSMIFLGASLVFPWLESWTLDDDTPSRFYCHPALYLTSISFVVVVPLFVLLLLSFACLLRCWGDKKEPIKSHEAWSSEESIVRAAAGLEATTSEHPQEKHSRIFKTTTRLRRKLDQRRNARRRSRLVKRKNGHGKRKGFRSRMRATTSVLRALKGGHL